MTDFQSYTPPNEISTPFEVLYLDTLLHMDIYHCTQQYLFQVQPTYWPQRLVIAPGFGKKITLQNNTVFHT